MIVNKINEFKSDLKGTSIIHSSCLLIIINFLYQNVGELDKLFNELSKVCPRLFIFLTK